MQTGVGMSVDKTTPSSDGFCVVREIHRGGAVDISGYEQKNDEMLRVQVGDCLVRVNGTSCKHMPRAEVKRYIVGPAGTKVELVFASKRDNKNITGQLFRMPKEKGTEVEVPPEINHERDRSIERERDRSRGRSPSQEIRNAFPYGFHVIACSSPALNVKAHSNQISDFVAAR